jgi:hypothetical protein
MAGKVPPILAIPLLAVVVVILAGYAGGRSTTRPTAVAPSTTAARSTQPVTLADTRQWPVPIPTAPPRLESEPGQASTTATPSCGRQRGRAGVKADPDYVDNDGSIHM